MAWKKEISVGYSKSTGNTQNKQLSASLSANRKTSYNEIALKGESLYTSSNNNMDTQKWYLMGRYAFSFWNKKWYNFYKLESDHDKFANINYRITPSTGVGYWFSDSEVWKAMVEVGVGSQHTNFRDSTKSTTDAVLVPRSFFEREFSRGFRIS